MTIQEAGQQLLFQLYHVYDNREAANIADLVMENLTGWKRIERVTHQKTRLSDQQQILLHQYMQALSAGKPVQYVLHEAWFFNMKFYVDESVLIPRPETEELVDWILKATSSTSSVLDVGTGSGCIAVALKKKAPQAMMLACDISDGALAVAERNAKEHRTTVKFLRSDVLDKDQWKIFPIVDVIVSNPPYIPGSAMEEMKGNVVDHEPHQALFVPDSDPLIFYKAIAELGKKILSADGFIYVEIYEGLAENTAALFRELGYSFVEIRKDMQEKERMIRASMI